MSEALVHRKVSDDRIVRTLVVDHPKGNVLDRAVCTALHEAVGEAAADADAGLLVVTGAGDDFSFGASVEEHLPEHADEMLGAMHTLVGALARFPYPTLAAVRGRCLGGGLEVALACDLLFAEEGSVLGTPEIRLGVFAPAATALLASTVPRQVAAEILLTGRDCSAEEMARWGLVNRIVGAGGLEEAVTSFADEQIRPRSPASLRIAVRALRSARGAALDETLDAMEHIYLDELLALEDGSEGIRAFLEKRRPRWKNG